MAAIVAYLLREGDHEAALAAAEYRGRRPVLSTELTQCDGRVYWGRRCPSSAEGRRILDVTHLGLHRCRLSELRPLNTVTDLAVRDGRVRLSGRVLNPLGRVAPDADISACLEVYDRHRPRRVFRFPATVTHAGDALVWKTEFDSLRQIRPLGLVDPVWEVRLLVRVDGEEIVTHPSGLGLGDADPWEHVLLPVRPRLSRLTARSLRPCLTSRGRLAFVMHADGPAGRMAAAVARTRWGRRLRRGIRRMWAAARRLFKAARRAATSRRTKTAVFNRVLSRLPVRTGTVVFESQLGRRYSGNPKYIHRELRRAKVPVRAVWSYDSSPQGFPDDAVLVRRG
ncbi:MAG: CDP-glycerol glycerophosphotransferase family protein, partial [Actinomadura rubrobrunea]|nr:CDP-glycerol glycerophosphotransferase family protein [Actinomadura rubrobrunea]